MSDFDPKLPSTSVVHIASCLVDASCLAHDALTMFHAVRLRDISQQVQRIATNQYLETLPRAKDARFDCERPDRPASRLKGTRIGVIRDFVEWITRPGPCIFWLTGLTGTGKTTVARAIAELAQSIGVLGASFFFSQIGGELWNPALVFPTIAHQLALVDPKFCRAITSALKRAPQAPTSSLEQQLNSLIVEPLSQLERDDERVVAIVFDAYDKCESVGAGIILQLLVAAIPSLPFSLKVFVTSCPEVHIQSVLIHPNHYPRITAHHEIESYIVQGDISLYLRTEMRELRKKKSIDIIPDWFTEAEIGLLSQAAGKLFIYAVMLIRDLEDSCNPRRRLQHLLKLAGIRFPDGGEGPFRHLDDLYWGTLQDTIAPPNMFQASRLPQIVLGSIVLLRDPLPVDALERLTGMKTGDALTILNSCHSVVPHPAPPSYYPLACHKTFSDFLQDPGRCTDTALFIETQRHEERMAMACLILINTRLHKGMPGNLNTSLVAELRYACRHWASHLAKAPHTSTDLNALLSQFASQKLIPWMEVMSWLGYGAHGFECLKDAQSWAVRRSPIVTGTEFIFVT